MAQPITSESRAYAHDMGFDLCEECGAVFAPLPGFPNDGHTCHADGTITANNQEPA